MFCSHYENSDKIFPTSEDWVLWAQYAVGMTCMKQYSKRYQSDQVVLKLELWWIKVCLEQSNAPLLSMVENIQVAVGAYGTDLTKP